MQSPDLQSDAPVDFNKVTNKDGYYFTVKVQGTSAATAANYGRFAALRLPIQILWVAGIWEVAGTDGGAVTCDVVVVNDGSAISTGTSVLTAPFNLKAPANTLVVKEARNLSNSRLVKPNQTLALKTSGTLTSVAGVEITVYYARYAQGSYK